MSLGLPPGFRGRPALLLALFALTGCATSLSPYVSPRVTGRVLDSQSHQPIPKVKIQRVSPGQSLDADQSVKGGQAIERAFAIWTGPNGMFVVESEKDLFARSGWYSVSLSFEHPAYQRLVTHYSVANSTPSPDGEPVVNAGDILLRPLPP
jgi:hypothetical protein